MLKAGDIIGFSATSFISDLINVATLGIPRFGISHVGIIGEASGRLYLFESTTLDSLPCELTGKPFSGTQAHTLARVVEHYKGKVYHFPLYRDLYDIEAARLTKFLLDTLHTPYDELGAMRSGGVGLSWVESLFRSEDLTSIFCSEYVAKAYSTTGLLPTDDSSRWNPNRLIYRLRRREILCHPDRLK